MSYHSYSQQHHKKMSVNLEPFSAKKHNHLALDVASS